MKRNNSTSGTDSGKIAGLILLALIWVWLVYMLFSRGGVDLKNIFLAAASGIIIFVPLWKRYLQPILANRKKK
ncbi:MAG: hypothetical protein K2I37_09455 [Muribaculaceae bacterium]|nr:hypothetical protein [Muribaculaceae bacterium]MDE7342725.1 hypothetical protein [Muribaculaceae bacterium]